MMRAIASKRKLRIRWTCSDYARHYHWWKWTAWLCGRVQYYWRRITGKPIDKIFFYRTVK